MRDPPRYRFDEFNEAKWSDVRVIRAQNAGRNQKKKRSTPPRNVSSARAISRSRIEPVAFIAPGILLVFAVMLYPTIHGVWMSLFDTNIFTGQTWFVGINQYVTLFQDANFQNALRQSLVLVFGTVSVGIVVSVTTALVMHHVPKGGRIWRTVVLIPWLISGIAIASIWRAIFAPTGGYATSLAMRLGLGRITWFANPALTMAIIILVSVWAFSPFATLIIYSGLKTVSQELYESASLDGANGAQCFRYITIPSIAPQFSLGMIFLSFGAFNSFDIILLMTGGGPGRSTQVLAILLYRLGFDRLDSHAAAAVMVVLLVINLVLSIFYIKILPSRD